MKTRLSPALPPEHACRLYRGMLLDALGCVRAVPNVERILYWSEPPATAESDLDPAGFEVRVQRGTDLGERLTEGFAELIREDSTSAVAIGADCPELEPRILERALGSLETHDLVIGPSRDGGYYLIGLRRLAPALFEGIAWSTPQVLAQTRARAQSEGLTVAELEPLADLDTPADLIALVSRALATPGEPRARHSLAALRALGLFPEST